MAQSEAMFRPAFQYLHRGQRGPSSAFVKLDLPDDQPVHTMRVLKLD